MQKGNNGEQPPEVLMNLSKWVRETTIRPEYLSEALCLSLALLALYAPPKEHQTIAGLIGDEIKLFEGGEEA